MKFKIGDKVRCIDDETLGWIVKGAEYYVIDVHDDFGIKVSLSENGKLVFDCFYKAYRFELVKENNDGKNGNVNWMI